MDKPIGKLRLSRSELIACGILLLGVAGFGVYRLDQALYEMREPQILQDAVRTVAPGETLSLAYREVGREHNRIPWNGTVEMSIHRVALYPSYADAAAVEKDAGNPNGLLNDTNRDDPFLVVEVEVSNINAEEGDYRWYQASKDAMGISDSDGAVTLHSYFDLYSETPFNRYGSYIKSAIWCVDGVSSSEYSVKADVAQGETMHVTLGFALEDKAEEHLNNAYLIYGSSYDRMDIGSPTIGGEEDETASQ